MASTCWDGRATTRTSPTSWTSTSPRTIAQFGDPHPEIYEPLAEASQLASAAEAAPLYAEANNAIKELVPMVPIAHAGAYFAAGANVQGAHATPWGHVQLNLWDNGTDTLVFMQGNEPISLYCSDETDGESLRACGQVVEGLYSYTIDGIVRPQLATECVPNDDLSLWTCSLREGVLFHDGSTFDANDVVIAFSAGLDVPIHSMSVTPACSSTTATCGDGLNEPES